MAKEKLSEFERYKRKLNIRKKLSAIFWLLLITAVAAGGVVWFGAFSKSEFGVAFRSQFTRDEQFPIALSGGSIRQIEPLEWDICFINDTDFYVYDNKGNMTFTATHGFASPVLKTDGGRALLYDQGGTRFLLTSSSRQLAQIDAGYAIHAADVASDGSVAVATPASQHATQVTVYDSLQNQPLVWKSSENMATAIALSPDAGQVAISCINASGGELVSTVYLLDVKNNQEIMRAQLPGEFTYSVSFKDQSIHVITDKGVKSIDSMGRVRASFDYQGQQPMLFSDQQLHNTVLVLGNYRYMRSSEVVSLDAKCKQLARFTVDTTVDSLKVNERGIYYLSDNVVYHYDFGGKLLAQTEAPGTGEYLPLGQSLYAGTYEELRRLEIR